MGSPPEKQTTATPIGAVSSLDLNDTETQRKVLSLDKHQILEGLVFEDYFEREIAASSSFTERLNSIGADTGIVKGRDGCYLAFVFVNEDRPGLGLYLAQLLRLMKVWVVRFDEDVKDFVAQKVFPSISDNSFDFPVILNPPRPLWLVTKEQGLQKVEHYDVAESVRDGNRQQAAFWGGLFPTLDRRRLRRITLSRLFFNFGLMPYFKYVWNVDKVFFDGNEIFVMEIKHKFPYASRGKLKFGINNGELKNMLKFASVGMRNVHLVIVKPVRKKDYSTQILFTDGNHIRNTAVIAREVSEQEARGTLMSKGGTSAAHTSLEGKTSQPYKAFDADTFAVIGMKSDDGNELGSHLVEMLSGKETKRCTDAFLNGLQMFV